jgi:hypothetical protein
MIYISMIVAGVIVLCIILVLWLGYGRDTTASQLPPTLPPPKPPTFRNAYLPSPPWQSSSYTHISGEDLDKIMKRMDKVSPTDPNYLRKLTELMSQVETILPEPVHAADDTCGECGDKFAMVDDYLCPKCRADLSK